MLLVFLLSCLALAIAKDDVMCPDGKSLCASSYTCCLMPSGSYGCCPLPNAVCCNDRVHCCPTNYKCDLGSMTCNRDGRQIPMLKHRAAKNIPESVPVKTQLVPDVGRVICPGGRDYCQDGSTCCLIGDNEYACCPMLDAVCCPDHVHCCPNGYKCNIQSGGCVRKGQVFPLTKKSPAKKLNAGQHDCSQGRYRCPDGSTCCPVEGGEYGCCPMPDAVCCEDMEHCCPRGFRCNLEESRCVIGHFSIPMLKKTKAVLKETVTKKEVVTSKIVAVPLYQKGDGDDIFCPDHKSSCPEKFTCCLTKTGMWGCCPLPKATCCSDRMHCCPEGSKCDLTNLRCVKANGEIVSMFTKQKAVVKAVVNAVICPDGMSQCPTGYTCCLLSNGMYGCCPYKNAVCCNDHIHCCPSGTRCDTSSGNCLQETAKLAKISKKQSNSLIRVMAVKDVTCPDKISSCPSGSTCCRLASGAYGCCPLKDAVCCSDGIHCCPSGFTCAVSSGLCQRGDFYLNMVKKVAAKVSKNGLCPDGSSCPTGYTCCKLATGRYGCCPLPNAVCCSDGKHCCPSGYTCDTSSGHCLRGKDYTRMVKKIAATFVKDVICPDKVSQCPSGSTCCKLNSGGYGCCPLPRAVCCKDGVHCCPSGYSCSVGTGTCVKGIEQKKIIVKIAAKSVENVVCPDGQSQCPSGNTCCKLASGQYGCCPLPHAVCCSDGVHCCPNGYTCASGHCTRGNSYTEMMVKIAAKPVENVVCPDGQSQCPSGNTCCKLASGQYGCCPLPHAVCCSDGVHCCPNGYTCASGHCTRGNSYTEMMVKIAAKPVENVVCPDGQSQCPSGNTCCKLASGQYGCCPLPHAVCCSDGVHCCPNGYTCASGHCTRGNSYTEMMVKIAAKPVENVVCPDGQSQCPSGNTCCKLASGQYGCCPLPHAVCCSDGVHCCPNGYTCASGHCTRGNSYTEMMVKIAAKPVENVVCPDGQSQCPSGNTCCKLASGQYGCCPLPHAVCCSDGVHCCPNGYTCASGHCTRGNSYTEMMVKIAAKPVENVVCPDGQSQCPSGNTCCKLASGQYGCCPLPHAVCCSDGVHCCPNGYTCASGHCTRGNSYTEMMVKIAAKPVENVVCPDGQSQCPSGNTCCKLASGGYGCCPLPHAVCCSDGVHCCPNGYTCASGHCTRGNSYTEMMVKIAAKPVENVVCPDGQSQCPSGNTCCRLASGGYGCCPLPHAVCCSDGVHCCPNGYTCASGHCTRGNSYTEMMVKIAAKPVENVICPDGQSQCPSGNTCCKLASGQYGCCPLPHAVCCSDGVHCCPNGYTCASGHCTRGNSYTEMMVKIAAKPVENVVCPDGQSQCPSGNTCCKLASGQYGCCPLPHAVCCSDGVHCCPNGYTCASGHCTRGNSYTEMMVKIAAKPVENVVCPDGQSQCPSGNTCCKLASGQYGCCPLPHAVCCSDGVHCCPNGYTCASGHCTRGNSYTEMMVKIAAKPVENVICPDGQSQCPSGNTCCKLASGQYGCCPLPHAVCCSDGVHCCPNGYTCASGHCTRGNSYTEMMVKIAAKPVENVVCPDGQSQCPSGNTCCKLASGQYGCCPLPHAVCCSDGVHCCPNGYTCASGHCTRGNSYTEMMVKIAAKPVENVVCPDGQSQCPSGNTCCKLASGQYGCCPLPHAVCCSDGAHCCPNGYTCASGHCTRGNSYTEMMVKIAAKPVENVVCPDGQSQCPSGNTCCKLASGGYGCCPLPHAVCCSDGVHCCPNGYTCSGGFCNKAGLSMKALHSIPWLRKLPAKSVPAEKKKPTQDPYIRF